MQSLLLLTTPEAATVLLLMRRETKVLAAIADGRTSQHIAAALCLSLLTIEAHRRHLLTKFRVNNMALLIR